MPKIQYREHRFSSEAMSKIEKANEIIGEYQAQGLDLTLRQLYYQFVARALIPNNDREYKKLGSVIDDGRMAGLIDWDAIEDRTRILRENSHWNNPQEILNTCARSYRIDLWENQKSRPQVWVEKDALIGVIESACSDLDVPCFSCRGYSSQSAMWRAGQLIRAHSKARGQRTVVFHLGDHDPSGVDMSRDIDARLRLLSRDGPVEVKRIALNMNQVRRYNPPPNPAKLSDVRATDYIAKFGNESWELDALDPKVLIEMIRTHVLALRNGRIYDRDIERQELDRAKLNAVSIKWNDLDLDVEAFEEDKKNLSEEGDDEGQDGG